MLVSADLLEATKDGLLNTLKSPQVLLDPSQKHSPRRYKIYNSTVMLGQLEWFLNYKNLSSIIFRKLLDEI